MPAYHAMLPEFNRIFGPAHIRELDVELFAPGRDLVEAVQILRKEGVINIKPAGVRFLRQVPDSLLEGVRAILYNAVSRRLPVMFAWAPGYDFELNAWEATSTTGTTGGITVLVRSPYRD
jgi:hypothetical protein